MEIVKNDLFDYGLEIFQDKDAFKFSLDSILLAEFVEIKKDVKTIVDFCSGNGAVPLILSTKFDAKILGFEIQKSPYKLAFNSIKLNGLDDKIKMINDNLNNALEYILPETVDIITCNPPYFKYKKESNINEVEEKAIARHEIETNLDSILMSAKYILKNKGTLYMVHRPERLQEIINVFDKYKFAIKKMQFIYSDYKKSSLMVLIKATKNGLEGMKVNPPINVMDYKTYKNIFE
ncbi:MAG: tRNA1(Val) (adenine(37)-N6)-methyltransferase [Bacilli bacterium]|nr:tRNA1(Val) (adenine(37)-N6)-methyltransferase [Bacilli bacterium]